jgi:hypothetical protein
VSMTPEERRLYVGLAIFGTLAGGGVYVVIDHALWGVILIGLGLLGFVYGLWEGRAVANRNWPWLLALALTWVAIGYDYYDRHRTEIVHFDKRPPLKNVTGREYFNESVPLDGFRYTKCKFTNVTLIYNGTSGWALHDDSFVGSVGIYSESDSVFSTIATLKFVGALKGNTEITYGGTEAIPYDAPSLPRP